MRRFLGVVGALALTAGMLVAGAGPAGASEGGRVVRPGGSIQAAIDAADPGATIVVRPGTYSEHLVITKSVNLVGFGAVLVPPAGDAVSSPCSAPDPNTDGICVAGDFTTDPNTGAVTVNSYVHDVRISGFTIHGFGASGINQIGGSGSTFVANRATGNGAYGIAAFDSTGTTAVFNTASGSGEAGFYIGDSPHANATLAANTSVDNQFGFFIRDAEHGRIIANKAHDNCLGILFLADAPGPDGAFNVAGNLIRHNDKACPGSPDTGNQPLSGVGVAIIGAHDVSLHANAILDNNPSGPTRVSAGVAVITGRNGAGTPPMNNRVQGNVIQRNSTDILWDGHGTGNVLRPNRCETSNPAGLCR